MADPDKPRRRRANGEESRQKILDAATEIAASRGYDGTSIALVSQLSGLPASSIYWHFADKDELIAAVIERSFGRWLDKAGAWVPPNADATREELVARVLRQTAEAILDAPDFMRLGLMLALERRPVEAKGRTMFLGVRAEARRRMMSSYRGFFPGLDDAAIGELATFVMAMADGLLIAAELDDADLVHQFELLAVGVVALAGHLSFP